MIFGVPFIDNNARQTAAIIEGITTNARHTVADCNACQTAAISEGIITDARHAVGDCETREPFATRES